VPQQEEKKQEAYSTNVSSNKQSTAASRAIQHKKTNDIASLSKPKGTIHSTPRQEIQVKLLQIKKINFSSFIFLSVLLLTPNLTLT
jgi:hypothetical protein